METNINEINSKNEEDKTNFLKEKELLNEKISKLKEVKIEDDENNKSQYEKYIDEIAKLKEENNRLNDKNKELENKINELKSKSN